jgi:hypothetical protein
MINTENKLRAKTDAKRAGVLCLWFYLAALFLSIVYILTTGTLNGDFDGVQLTLSLLDFSFVIVASLVPYLFGYWVYLRFSRHAPPPIVRVSNAMLGITFFLVTSWFIFLAIKYDVGVMGRGLYKAPELLTPLIQLTNRINPFYLGIFFIVGYQGSRKIIFFGITLMIILGLLRAGLGVFIYVFLALVIRNHHQLRRAVRRHCIKIFLFLLMVPFAISQLYSLRSELRGQEDIHAALTITQIVGARLVGRLSSISNSVFIIQEHQQFESDAQQLDPWYFQRQALAPLLGVGIIPEVIPERLLVNAFGGTFFDVSYMAGVPGNLAMSWFVHPLIAVANAISMIFMIWLSFFFANKLDIPYRNEVCFMLLLYPLTSGVGNEFSFIAVSMLVFIVLFKLLRLLSLRKFNSLVQLSR